MAQCRQNWLKSYVTIINFLSTHFKFKILEKNIFES